jgi:hypothetical protein
MRRLALGFMSSDATVGLSDQHSNMLGHAVCKQRHRRVAHDRVERVHDQLQQLQGFVVDDVPRTQHTETTQLTLNTR